MLVFPASPILEGENEPILNGLLYKGLPLYSVQKLQLILNVCC